MEWTLRPSTANDAAWIAEVKAQVMRPDLERLGRFDEVRVRRRLLDAFEPAFTRVVVVDGTAIGSIAVRPEPDARWIEHFYLDAAYHGRGLGGAVLRHVLAEPDTRSAGRPRPFRLDVVQGSPARRLYERHGFVLESEDPIDVIMVRPAAT